VRADDARVDRDALLCALVLAPTTFARNRFFVLYTEPWAKRTRSRAAQLRTIVRHLAAATPKAVLREVVPVAEGGVVVRYAVPDLHFERTAMLEPLELSVVRFALARRPRPAPDDLASADESALAVTDEDRRNVEAALSKLGQKLGLAPVDVGAALGPPPIEVGRHSSTVPPPSSPGDS
jgi:hypothetical protein